MDIRSTRAFKFWERYEHHLGVGALAFGFFFDLIMADRPDSTANNLLLLSYIFIAGAFIVILNLREVRRQKQEHSPEPFFFLLVLQFCFGGLASNLLVLYGRSGTLVGSAVFLGLLLALVFANEFLRNRYVLLRFNVGMYYFLLLSYLLIATPVYLTHRIGTGTFVLTGVLSLVAIALFLLVLWVTVFRRSDSTHMRSVAYVVGGIYIAFNLLYFTNVIPPVPLSLKDIGVYHSVLKRSDGGYTALYEPAHWWEVWRATSGTYTIASATSASCFSSVFAPTSLTAPVYHRWEQYNERVGDWVTLSYVSFGISGGRDEGYRGYTTKASLTPGQWRCSVETAQGQLIGRVGFDVVQASTTPTLSQKTL